MLTLIIGILVLSLTIALWKGTTGYFRFAELCRLVAIAEDAMSELNSTKGMDGNSANPFERTQLKRIRTNFFVGYGDPEIERLAAQVRRDFIAQLCAIGVIWLIMLSAIVLPRL
ncbi:hypothetical protein [Undibacterium terreum]|uniref:Uncharacterized protein n=1 Tax=Undibacterium terreum TaxID=1224302 RepID=A0A916UBQ3_9BURK|nr:hypothetical protein [Undibacterium terreum]GGC65168.1 hypothetical protein GCM10011396_10210 [Undibacterium terreum]